MTVFSAVAALLSSLAFQPYASGFAAPVYVTAPRAEPGVLYVVEQGGAIWRLRNGKRDATPFLDLRGSIASGGERGLLSVAFDPGYAKNRLLYVDYTDRQGDTRVVRFRSDGRRALPKTAVQLLLVKQPFSNHNGGQLQFGPDGALYVGMGDGGSGGDPGNRAQDLQSRLGKLLRYRGGRWQIAAYGLRNPWRFSFDRVTGALWIGDVGQDTWEEIDTVPRGFGLTNFGWRVYEGLVRYQPDQTPNQTGKLVGPVWVYHHGDDGCSVTGGYVYRGSAVPELRGRYVFGDFCSGKIWSLSGGTATPLPSVVPQLSSFGEDAAGELYAVSLAGEIFKLASA
jgi:glucose/arabinose dehydrogenase